MAITRIKPQQQTAPVEPEADSLEAQHEAAKLRFAEAELALTAPARSCGQARVEMERIQRLLDEERSAKLAANRAKAAPELVALRDQVAAQLAEVTARRRSIWEILPTNLLAAEGLDVRHKLLKKVLAHVQSQIDSGNDAPVSDLAINLDLAKKKLDELDSRIGVIAEAAYRFLIQNGEKNRDAIVEGNRLKAMREKVVAVILADDCAEQLKELTV